MKRKPLYTIDEIRQKVAPIAKRYGVARVYLFGSYASNRAGARSDVDLRIDAGRIKDYFRLAQLYGDLEESLKTKVDLLTTCALEEGFLERIAKDEVLLYAE
ncbi:MAG: nucleotidyltransferase domain-containing protein [Chitinispirillia bacterium]|nr:nucleotidyltransferase domain-containing protein [Chitinispirillia bacterium]MCL2242397.1 nucleotidyltransferase domain-containing protein [Chitinispirillia bacterium]